MRKLVLSLCVVASASLGCVAQNIAQWSQLKGELNLFVANDLGRNGYYDQKPIAAVMGLIAEEIGPEAVLAAGDVHHFEGVASVNDPLWMTNYELIYTHPELMIEWLPILGNHEYRGNTEAVLGYSAVSRRWCMPDRYYTRVFEEDGVTLRVVMIDTAPIIEKYRNDSITYADAAKQDYTCELQWVDSVLSVANEDWVIVVGHHPIYAQTPKADSERWDLQQRLDPILRRHKVDAYIAGHIHNFQHIRIDGSEIDYIVNSSGSLSREVAPIEGTRYCSSEPGFTVIAASAQQLKFYFVDKNGDPIYTITRD